MFMRQRSALLTSGVCLLASFVPSFHAEEPSAPNATAAVQFNRDIRPILSNKCFKCHGPDLKKGGLDLQNRAAALKELPSGETAIVPGKSVESQLVKRITSHDDDERMPPKGKSDRLTPEQIAKLRAWIDQGAVYEEHWAYVKPVRPPLPTLKHQHRPRNEIDYFVLARLEQEGLTPSPEADRATLIRRLSLDLIGLPPTLAEVNAFLADDSPEAYEKVVDRLLASAHYGEHWARPWLDEARYADTNGYEKDDRRTMWPYRDWVINALNRDLPFDKFTIEQLAGDLLPNATVNQKIATGFHRNTMVNTEGGTDDEEFRVAALVDRVNTTMSVWMGLTINCTQCHNHKFDPFTQKEFYQLFAFFNGTADRGGSNDPQIEAPTPEQVAVRERLMKQIAPLQAKLDTTTPELAEGQRRWEHEASKHLVDWAPLEPTHFESAHGATLTKQPDGSVLVGGVNADKDNYTVELSTELHGITALRLVVMPDPSLPKQGPGRAANGNFVLSGLNVVAAAKNDPTRTEVVDFHGAIADFTQPPFAPTAVFDGVGKSGWAVDGQIGKPHQIVFETRHDLGFEGGTVFTVTMEQQHGQQHNIGRFRWTVTTSPRPVGISTLPADVVKLLHIQPAKRTEQQTAELARYYRSIAPELGDVRKQKAELDRQLAAVKPATTLVLQELPSPRPTHVLIRGNHKNLGEVVTPGVPAKLHPLRREQNVGRSGAPSTEGRSTAPSYEPNPSAEKLSRLDLAKWLVDPDNPLVGRVTMNRIWARYFGRGLVETSEDFGVQGEPPSHPELLDWLATEFVRQGWSMKAMHKLIVMSATYRQSSRVTRELVENDPFNRYYARGPRFRLDAEMVRDNVLAISGLLDRKIGGPSVFPYQPEGVWNNPYSGDKWATSTAGDQYRRGLYTFWRRTAPYAAFMAFDAPSREICCERRPRTNTPLQALATLNDKAYVEPAAALARRMMAEVHGSDEDRAVHGFRLCVARNPTTLELEQLLHLYRDNLEKYRKDSSAAKQMATSGLAEPPKDMDVAELAAWTVVANVLLNLDETITKG